MSRKSILVFGAICWTGAAANAIYHVAIGTSSRPRWARRSSCG